MENDDNTHPPPSSNPEEGVITPPLKVFKADHIRCSTEMIGQIVDVKDDVHQIHSPVRYTYELIPLKTHIDTTRPKTFGDMFCELRSLPEPIVELKNDVPQVLLPFHPLEEIPCDVTGITFPYHEVITTPTPPIIYQRLHYVETQFPKSHDIKFLDVVLVAKNCEVSYEEAFEALVKYQGDVVNAMMSFVD